jgi:hypothetical protein
MTFSYSPDIDSGKVRLLCGDTVQANAIFTDEEIGAVLASCDQSPHYAAAFLLTGLASQMARSAHKKTAAKYSQDLTRVAAELREQAKAIVEMANVPWEAVIEQTFENVEDISRRFEDQRARDFIIREYIRGNLG